MESFILVSKRGEKGKREEEEGRDNKGREN